MDLSSLNIHDLADALTAEQIEELLASLPANEILALKYKWEFWARRNQLAPSGDWTYWLALAGRGFGKTRMGAEWIRAQAESGKHEYISLVGPTNGDVRRVMIDGESGLLKISPPWFKPEYQPSKARVVWPNGCIAELFSAEEPDRLRGPQCFPADTTVSTVRGDVAISDVVVGDEVYTHNGVRRVVRSWKTSDSEDLVEITTSTGRKVRCTRDHLVYEVRRGFTAAVDLMPGDLVCVTDVLNSTGENSTATVVDILNTEEQDGSEGKIGKDSISQFGKRPTDPCQKDTSSTIRTTTSSTTNLTTSNLRRLLNTALTTLRKTSPRSPENWQLKEPPRLGLLHRWRTAFVKVAGLVSSKNPHRGLSSGTAVKNATGSHSGESHSDLKGLANGVGSSLSPKFHLPSTAPVAETGIRCEVIESVVETGMSEPVYDLTVEHDHVFFANGILVHNCSAFWADEIASWGKNMEETWSNLMFGFRLGNDPRGVITTTPRPLPLIKKLANDENTHVTSGTTYENAANLAKPFFNTIITQYEGTRLGRQELLGHILDDNPNALFYQKWFDAARLETFPTDCETIAVGVDPQVKEDIKSDEAGIVVAGMKKIGGIEHFYVAADYSFQPEKPDQWGREAAKAYYTWQANKVIAEVNNGGALVKNNIQAVDSKIPVEMVTATRGKSIRAEPVATLAEQGRIHMCGKFGELETQCTDWDPTLTSQKSPDRMDAFVWVISYLSGAVGTGMVQGRAAGR